MADKENKVVEAKATKASKPKKANSGKVKKAFREFKAEFKKIVWSSKRTTFSNTVLVIVAMVIVAAVVGALDAGFSKLLQLLGGLY